MKPLISIIIVALLGTGVQVIAESAMEKQERLRRQATGETQEEKYERLKRFAEEVEKELQEQEVVLIDKGQGWTRYMFDGQELVIDGDYRKGSPYEFDMSDQATIDRIVTSVRTIRRYGKSCNVVKGFRTSPNTRILCVDGRGLNSECLQITEWDKTEYGRTQRFISVIEKFDLKGGCY